MAIFNKKEEGQKKDTKQSPAAKNAGEKAVANSDSKIHANTADRLNDILRAPRITEKTVRLMDKGVYTFNVRKDANKTEVAKAVKMVFKVTPIRVSMVNYPTKPKRNSKTGKIGRRQGGKKALVYLKKGDKISII